MRYVQQYPYSTLPIIEVGNDGEDLYEIYVDSYRGEMAQSNGHPAELTITVRDCKTDTKKTLWYRCTGKEEKHN